jgi:hypothetical protein
VGILDGASDARGLRGVLPAVATRAFAGRIATTPRLSARPKGVPGRREGKTPSWKRDADGPKDAFPSEAVYGPTPDATLRLITCGGTFDQTTGHHRDNYIAFAHLRGPA